MDTEYAIEIEAVSSEKQLIIGDSHEDQARQIQLAIQRLEANHKCRIVVKKRFNITGSRSGAFDVQPLLVPLNYCKEQNKHKVIIKFALLKSIDRATRAGALVFGYLKNEFIKAGVTLVDTYGVISTQNINTLEHLGISFPWSVYSTSWITEMLEAERAKSEVRDILTRMIGAEVNYVRLGYRVRPAPPGYKNIKEETTHGMRVVLAPHDIEAPWFIRMFELRIQGNLTDGQIVEEINKMGFKTRIQKLHDKIDKKKVIGFKGGNPLDVEQLRLYLQRPIYAGINIEKWTEGKPVKGKFKGLVTIEMFNKANRGKVIIVEDGDMVRIYKNKPAEWLLRKQKDNPLYPYKKYVLCPKCFEQFYASGSRGSKGLHYPAYHCGRKHKLYRIPLDKFNKTISSYVENVRFSNQFIKWFKEVYLEEWEKREQQASQDTVLFNNRLVQIEGEIKAIKETIKKLSNPSVINMMEDDIGKLELERVDLMVERTKAEDEQISVQTLMSYAKFFMEHLVELLLQSPNPIQKGVLFELLFDELPTYEDLDFGTAKLAPLFELNDKYKTSKSVSVSRPGFEPGTKSLKGFCSTVELSARTLLRADKVFLSLKIF
jgi:site-specific DNA recombinase